jgi:hypothetical protein
MLIWNQELGSLCSSLQHTSFRTSKAFGQMVSHFLCMSIMYINKYHLVPLTWCIQNSTTYSQPDNNQLLLLGKQVGINLPIQNCLKVVSSQGGKAPSRSAISWHSISSDL